MTIYLIILCFSIFIGYICPIPIDKEGIINTSRIRTICSVFFATIFILIIGLRSPSVGSDSQIYYERYYSYDLTFNLFYDSYADYLKEGILNFFQEKNTSLFQFLSSFFSRLGLPYNAFLTLIAVIYVGPVFYLVSKDSSNVGKSCFWFIVFSLSLALSGVRVILAMGLTTMSYICILKHKRALSVILFGLAVITHLSAFIFVGVFFLEKIRFNKKSLRYLIPLFVLTPFIGFRVSPWVLQHTYYQEVAADISWKLPIYVFFSLTAILFIYFSPAGNNRYYKMLVIGAIVCGLVNYGSLGNIHKYFTQYFCICFPNLMYSYKKTMRFFVEVSYLLVGLYLFMRTYTSSHFLVPYEFYWQ